MHGYIYRVSIHNVFKITWEIESRPLKLSFLSKLSEEIKLTWKNYSALQLLIKMNKVMISNFFLQY